MDLTERVCKWPIGDPATDDFYFCGLPVQQGKPYCEAHVGVAFQPMSSRRHQQTAVARLVVIAARIPADGLGLVAIRQKPRAAQVAHGVAQVGIGIEQL